MSKLESLYSEDLTSKKESNASLRALVESKNYRWFFSSFSASEVSFFI